jgi:NADPH-dependent 2,4-dienoyl-CoA reductase/sulfur reductase-like enzyme
MLSADDSLPCDRPNLSKGYLAGSASEQSSLLRSAKFYGDLKIDVRLGTLVESIDLHKKEIEIAGAARLHFDALLLSTGASPVRLDVAGATLPHVHYLRTLADGRRLVLKAQTSRRAVIIGASFIGLEVAASLRARNIEVDVVGREASPMARVLGPEVGTFIRRLHESHGVTFHLEATAAVIDEKSVTLTNGEKIQADLVVIGIGVRPETALAARAGLTVERGVVVNEFLETSASKVFAAGDIARWPDRLTGESIRVEHFVVAERQGQTAARNILGQQVRFDAVPFFWTEQFDFALGYVGHAEQWDKLEIDGSLEKMDCMISYWRAGKKLAVAVVRRDLEGLRAEVEFERGLVRCGRPTGTVAQIGAQP